MNTITWPTWRWDRQHASVTHVSIGADRFEESSDPLPPRRRVGFTAPRIEREPLVWEGDNA